MMKAMNLDLPLDSSMRRRMCEQYARMARYVITRYNMREMDSSQTMDELMQDLGEELYVKIFDEKE